MGVAIQIQNGSVSPDVHTKRDCNGPVCYFFLLFAADLAASACFFCWSALLALVCFCEDAPDAARVADLVVGDGALAVADTGAWELWSLDGSRRIASGQASAPTAEGVPGTSVAAVGTALLSLVDGTVTPDALPAPVVAISPDGSLWVLGAEEDRALWRFGGAGN